MKRLSIRILVGILVSVALGACAAVPVPVNAKGHPALPAVALEQEALYRLEVALGVFYGGLLLITPAYSGLVEGRLPVEISARGAKFADGADESAEETKEAIEALERATVGISDELTVAQIGITRLDELCHRDDTQPKVDSKA